MLNRATWIRSGRSGSSLMATIAQQDQVVAGQDPPLQRGEHRLLEPDDRREQGLASRQAVQEVVAQLVLHGAVDVARGAELADGRGRGDRFHEPVRVPGNPAYGACLRGMGPTSSIPALMALSRSRFVCVSARRATW